MKVGTYGWVDAKDAEKINRGLTRAGDKWLTKEQIARKTGHFKTTFFYQGPMSSRSFLLKRLVHRDAGTAYGDHELTIAKESYKVFITKN